MKIAFTAKGQNMNSQIDPRFGRAKFIIVYDEDTKGEELHDMSEIADVAHGAGPLMSQKVMEMGVDIVITGNGPGGNASRIMERSNIKIFTGAATGTLQNALENYKKGALTEFKFS
jgi:predicted Fe-Mo cluster-binding NifX family protein